jgi:hypothetical protein
MKICLLKRKDTLGPEVLGGVDRPQHGAQGPLVGLHSISPRLVLVLQVFAFFLLQIFHILMISMQNKMKPCLK